MKLGIHALAWCKQWNSEKISLIDTVAHMGGEFIEIPMMNIEEIEPLRIKKRLQDAGIEVVTSTVLSAERDISSNNADIRKNGIHFLTQCIEASGAMGAKSFSGVIYSEFAPINPKKPTEQEWNNVVQSLSIVNNRAKDVGVMLGIEPVNRYETPLINTCEQAVTLKNHIGDDNIKIHLDTYHMNIEEKDYYSAVICAGNALSHFHLCENDRGIPGTGLVNWHSIFKGLKKINYKGYAGLESFVDLSDSMNTWVWRTLAPNGSVLLQKGLQFIRSMQKKYELS